MKLFPADDVRETVPAGASPKSYLGGKVLVVDDERPNRLYLKKLLSSYGCEVIEATDGPSALEMIHCARPDLILADVVMPGMDGFELCGAIKALPATRDLPVIMVTAKGQIEDLKKGFDLGAMDYIRKPFDARELVLRVGNALALKRSNDALAHWKRRVSHELELAGKIQQSMFSTEPFFSGPFEVRINYRSSMDVGGDAFDVISLPDGRCCVYVADVSGHGVAPAMISSMLKATSTELIRTFFDRGPAFICNELHVRLCATLNNPDYYATMLVALYEPENSRWVCMNCGHPAPVLIHGGKSIPFPPGGGGIPVGMPLGPDRPFAEEDQTVIKCRPGMHILLYTDGLTEALHRETGEECGEEMLANLFVRVSADPNVVDCPAALLSLIEAEGYAVGHDDCTAIAIRMADPDHVMMEGTVSVDLQSVSECTEKMERLLLEKADEDIAARVRLVAIEHAMNVVEHSGLGAQDSIWVQLILDETGCRLVFVDQGREWDISRADLTEPGPDEYAEGGRGLLITNIAADRVERYRRESKNIVSYVFRRQIDE
ncbi:MAG: SpoIIE family protein phosphatase [Verrucomicrobia bacterium]|nr:SpoIIE family protein phosphatase [Verrucomicrobiota bacterium]